DAEGARALFSELEFTRLIKDLPPPPSTPRVERTEIVTTREALDAAVAAARAAGSVAIRAAISGSAPRIDPATGVAFAAGGRAWYVPLAHRYLGMPTQLSEREVGDAL